MESSIAQPEQEAAQPRHPRPNQGHRIPDHVHLRLTQPKSVDSFLHDAFLTISNDPKTVLGVINASHLAFGKGQKGKAIRKQLRSVQAELNRMEAKECTPTQVSEYLLHVFNKRDNSPADRPRQASLRGRTGKRGRCNKRHHPRFQLCGCR